jgi:hypothetical protein
MFIICIGLLSVLMVIPYGAYQVSKARNAEFTSNMLAAGAEDLQIGEWNTDITNRDFGIFPKIMVARVPVPIYIVDPFVTHSNNPNPLTLSIDNTNFIQDISLALADKMVCKDDIDYVLKENDRAQIQNAQYLGQYKYFVTIKPKVVRDGTILYEILSATFTTDLLGCYKRVDDDWAVKITPITTPTSPQYYSKAAKFIIPSGSLDFSTTKYVFLTWTEMLPISRVTVNHGEWCKVVSAGENATGQELIVLVNDIAAIQNSDYSENLTTGSGIKVIIFPGVLYHKRIFD